MRRILIGAAALAATLLAPLALHTPLAQSPLATGTSAAASNARVIVKYRANSALMRRQALSDHDQRVAQASALGLRIGLTLRAGRALSDRSHVVMASGLSSKQLAARLSAESDIEYAVPDERKHIVAVPNDQFYASRAMTGITTGGPVVGQWYLKPPGAVGTAANTAPSSINAEQAWDVTTGSASVVVAVLDTGVRFEHPDLQGGNVLLGYDMVSDDDTSTGVPTGTFATANDGNGRDSDASDPGDWVTQAESNDTTSPLHGCTVGASSWHGTQTLGIIGAATDNGIGIASVGRNVRVMPVRVLGKCGGFDSDIVAGMRWAAGLHIDNTIPDNANKARVISMSLGSAGACDTTQQMYIDAISDVNAAGAIVIAAAGNDSLAVNIPANCAGAIAVAGLRSDGDKNGFSSLGPEVTISAPGGNAGTGGGCAYPIMSTANSGTQGPVASTYTDSAACELGTSFSTPMVSGAAALILSVQPSLTPAEVKSKLMSSARTFLTTGSTVSPNPGLCMAPAGAEQANCYCTTSTCGAGMLDVHAAVLAAAGAQARISVAPAAPTATQAVTLNSSSLVTTGHSIVSYQWAIVSTGGIVTGFVNGVTTGASVSVVPTAAGTFSVSLTTTDDLGTVSTATATVTVAAAVVTPPASTGSSGGGGALGIGWLLLLLSAVLALAAHERLERARRARLSAADRRPASRRG
jgi:serine protease